MSTAYVNQPRSGSHEDETALACGRVGCVPMRIFPTLPVFFSHRPVTSIPPTERGANRRGHTLFLPTTLETTSTTTRRRCYVEA